MVASEVLLGADISDGSNSNLVDLLAIADTMFGFISREFATTGGVSHTISTRICMSLT